METVASLLRFRHSNQSWSGETVRQRLLGPLDSKFGAEMTEGWFAGPAAFETRRFDMDNGDIAFFAWNETEAFWLGNTETPKALWKTNKINLDEAPYEVSRWTQRELLATLYDSTPWLESYPHLSWFFLPVFLSKDGRESSRRFFSEHAAGFPETDRETALSFYESFLQTGVLDQYRHVMAGKVGTSKQLNITRMTAAMGEFNAAYLLSESGYSIQPEAPVSTGHSIDFRADGDDGAVLVEVTRPAPPRRRNTNSSVRALQSTTATKTDGQLHAHGGGIVLFVDCTSFSTKEWDAIAESEPDVDHKPAVIYRLRPNGHMAGYTHGDVPLTLAGVAGHVKG